MRAKTDKEETLSTQKKDIFIEDTEMAKKNRSFYCETERLVSYTGIFSKEEDLPEKSL